MGEREKLMQQISALKAACAESHTSSIGGAAMCICGRGNGGSAACNALRNLRQLLMAVGAVQNGREGDLEVWREWL
jgi:tRNA A37 threonylcarbamoyladenosine dehydratase